MTQYLLSVYMIDGQEPPSEEEITKMYADVDVVNEELKQTGAWVFAGGLHPATLATVVRENAGEVLLTDGPFVETKEHLGGFAVVDVRDEAEARYWAGRIAVAVGWPQEVHRFPHRVALSPDTPSKALS